MSIPKFGMITNPMIDVIEEIKIIAKLGFDYVELGIEGPEGYPEIIIDEKNKILKLLKENNLFIIAHSPWWIELGSEYDNVRTGWIDECKKIIDAASALKISLVNFHSHSRGMVGRSDKTIKKTLDNCIDSLKELSEYAKRKNIQLMLENAAEKGEIVDLKNFKYIIENVPGLKVHLDIGHAYIHGGMKNIRDFIITFNENIEHIHMHDNHGMLDEHAPIGRGKIDYASVVKILKEINYDKTITFEVFTSKEDAAKSREKIKKFWNEK
jgi:sugar phosphate isomerase/epimerase